ncbi:MAG TPA: (Fe-S)-binding protein [Desulfomonilaceae bacterium]|nr:(Fe-S)-binding protein [Desulfomonilaceae bacterium]
MAYVVIFPNHGWFELGSQVAGKCNCEFTVLDPPEFCKGIVPPSLVVSGGAGELPDELRASRIPISGIIPHHMIRRDVPEAGPPDQSWKEAFGDLAVSIVRPSITDPLKLRVEIIPSRSLETLIPIIARFIRGGAFVPDVPILAFEEEHRLIALSRESIVFSRVDDLLDMWIILRCTVDLVITAWNRRFSLKPDTAARQGIGAMEIFKRLPATNCGRCGNQSCMEFATGLMTGRCSVQDCGPLVEGDPRYMQSLLWLMGAIGLDRDTPVAPEKDLETPEQGYNQS